MKQKTMNLRLRTAVLFLLMCLTLPGWATVTGSYDKSTHKLSFSGSGALTRDVVTAVDNYYQATWLVIGGDVTSIEATALRNLPNIRLVEFENGSTKLKIKEHPFKGCIFNSVYFDRAFDYDNGYEYWTAEGLFDNDSNLHTVSFGPNMESVPAFTFCGCVRLSTLDMSKATGLKSIGEAAFSGCSYLKTLTFPENIDYISSYAFSGCGSLESITIPGTVDNLGKCCFQSCEKLKELTFASGSASLYIGDNAFRSCPNIATFNCDRTFNYHPETLLQGVAGMFYKSETLERVTFGPNVESIPIATFNGCTNLTSVDFSSATKLVEICNYAFSDCLGLTSLSMPQNLEIIGGAAFRDCTKLVSIDLPSGLNTIDISAFEGCMNLKFIDLPSGLNKIGKYAFKGCRGIEYLTISGSVEILGDQCFMLCTSLKRLTLEDDDESLYMGKFILDSTAVENLYIGRNLKTDVNSGIYGTIRDGIGYTIMSCLKKVTIGPCVNFLPSESFLSNHNLSEVVINSDKLSSQNYTAYNNLATVFPNIVKLTIDENVNGIGNYAFCGSQLLEKVILTHPFINYDATTFQDCPKLGEISGETLSHNNVTFCYTPQKKTLTVRVDEGKTMPDYPPYNDGNSAPWQEYALVTEHLVLQGSITNIGGSAFRRFLLLESVEFDNPEPVLTSIHTNAFSDCIYLKEISFPSTLREIDSNAFANCTSLKSVNLINTSLTSLASSAFYRCSGLTSVLLPSTCITIGSNAFTLSKNIMQVACYSWPTSVGTNVFDSDIKSTAVLYYVPITGKTHPLASYFSKTENVSQHTVCGPSMTYSISNGVLTVTSTATEPVSTYDYEQASHVPWADKASTITQVVVKGPVSKIGKYLFSGLQNLKTVNLSQITGLTEISSHAYENCKRLTSISIPTMVTAIGNYAFNGCSSLTSITLPTDMTSLGSYAFANTGITSIVLPEGVTVIGEHTFDNCTRLSSITFSEGLRQIGAQAFNGCTALKSIDLPKGYTVIDDWAFAGSGLTSLTLQSSVLEIQEHAFDSCTELEEVITYGDSELNRICLYAFAGDRKLRRFVMPGRVSVIGYMAFKNCALEEVKLPNTLIELGDGAFQGCQLTAINIPTSLTELSSAFSYNTLLKKVIVPDNIKKVNDYAFSGCSSLSSVTLPDSLEYLGSGVFKNCAQLKEISIPKGITTIWGETFAGSGITSIDVPATVESIVGGAFSDCSKLQSVTLPDGLKTIGLEVFKNCTSLTEITLPDSLKTIGQYAFAGCSQLTAIYALPKKAPADKYGNAFDESVYSPSSSTVVYTADYDNYKWNYPWSEMNIQNPYEGYAGTNVKYSLEGIDGGYVLKLTVVGDGPNYTLYDGTEGELSGWLKNVNQFASKIIRIDMDEKLTGIGQYSLACLSAVKTLNIPASVTSIGTGAFAGMTSLEEIYLNNPVPTTNGTGVADADVYAKAIIYSSAPDTYKASTIWKKFAAENILPYATGWCGKIYTDEEWEENGYCEVNNEKSGSTVKYTLKGHELKIEGNLSSYSWIVGIENLEMQDYASYNDVPWYKYSEYVTDVKFNFNNGRLNRIGNYAFYKLKNVEHIDIPSQVESIGNNAFCYTGIKSVTFPENLTTIGNYAFHSAKLQSIEIPGSVSTLGENAFSYNSELESITFDDGVTKIPYCTLYNCPKLVTVNIPNTVTELDYFAFSRCTSLISVYIPNSVRTCGAYLFDSCTKLEEVHLPNVDQIYYRRSLFSRCKSLKSVVIPSQWTQLYDNFFEGCISLESITLPENIAKLGSGVFKGCTNLKTIQVERTTPVTLTEAYTPFTDWAMDDYGKFDATLFVPEGCVDAYANAVVWEHFNIQEEGVVELVDGTEYTNAQDQSCRVLTYTRTFNSADSWQALYVPFGMNYSDWSENFEIARINDVHQWDYDEDGAIDETAVEIVLVKDNIAPNTPYLIKAKAAGTQSIELTDATIYAAEENSIDCSSVGSKFTFTGTYSGITGEDMVSEGYYALGGGALHQASSADNDLSSYRWYMSVTDRNGNPKNINEVKVMMRNDDGTLTDIGNLKPETLNLEPSTIHNLSGTRVSKMTKGIYIKNGKKYFVK